MKKTVADVRMDAKSKQNPAHTSQQAVIRSVQQVSMIPSPDMGTERNFVCWPSLTTLLDVMDALNTRSGRGRGAPLNDGAGIPSRRPVSRNKQWFADQGGTRNNSATHGHADGERWVRGGQRGGRGLSGGRGSHRHPPASSPRITQMPFGNAEQQEVGVEETGVEEIEPDEEPELETLEEREKFYQELVKAREVERKKAIADGKMDDPLVAKRLEDAITLVGTCMDMCPRFERYRRERENSLFEWETIPGTKRVDHKRAVKMYERAAGDKTLPSDLRPPVVLKKTLDYLFHDLIPRSGFTQTFNFIRDRTRAVRNDFTMQHETGRLAMECHDRCARFHILALHLMRDEPGFSIALEEQQLMNTLQSLKEFYEDQRGRYSSPTELEMRVYHRLIHIRDQKERHEDVPDYITNHPVFKLTTRFRLHVQTKSAPIGKTTPLVVDNEALQIFGELAVVLRQQGSVVMIYLVACLLERLFGKETIDNIEAIRGELTIPELIAGADQTNAVNGSIDEYDTEMENDLMIEEVETETSAPLRPSATEWLSTNFGPRPTASAIFARPSLSTAQPSTTPSSAPPPASAFAHLSSSPNVFGTGATFGAPVFGVSKTPKSAFEDVPTTPAFGSGVSTTPASAPKLSTTPFGAPPAAEHPAFTFSKPSAEPPSSFGQTASTPAPPLPEQNGFVSASTTSQPITSLPSLVTSAPLSTLNPAAPVLTPSFSSSSQPTPSASSAEDITFSVVQPTPPLDISKPSGWPAPSSTSLFPSSVPPASAAPAISIPSVASTPPEMRPPEAPTKSRTSSSFGHPPLQRINTTRLEAQSSQGSILSPDQPPPLNRHQPISLPATPTSPLKLTSSKSWVGPVRQASVSSPHGLLSPLHLTSPMPTPTSSGFPVVPPREIEPTASAERAPATPREHAHSNGKGKQPAVDLGPMAIAFSRKSLLVKECFERWRQRTTDRAAWIEACQHSDAYRQKIKRQLETGRPSVEKKRTAFDAPLEKRARRRISSKYQPPRTDEELAQRFKENYKENERRWIKGSFLQAIRTHIKSEYGPPLPKWRIWVSMNLENDGTAIWLEHKFDAPQSGRWDSENVFSIPLREKDVSSSTSPGMIVFECTPLGHVSDELERKFRILDDCARLRDIIQSFPSRRHFVPSLLVVYWPASEQNELASDLLDMIKKLAEESVLASYHVFRLSSVDDLDPKFRETLKTLTFDVEGQLIQSCTVPEIFRQHSDIWISFYIEWIENCSYNGDFDWVLYARLIESCIDILNEMAQSVLKLMEINTTHDFLPSFDAHDIMDSESAYATILSWLANESAFGDGGVAVSEDLLAHRSAGRDFPTTAFLDHLRELAEYQTGPYVGNDDDEAKYDILKSEMTSALQPFESTIESHSAKLQQVHVLRLRRSPKRRFGSEETELSTASVAKRARLSSSGSNDESSMMPSPDMNGIGILSPSPSVSTISAAPSGMITISMLRALTKDIKQRYGSNSAISYDDI